MAGPSRWAENEDDVLARKREKTAKKQAKLERQRRQAEEVAAAEAEVARRNAQQSALNASESAQDPSKDDDSRPSKRRRVQDVGVAEVERELLTFKPRTWNKTRKFVHYYETLNAIGKGAYGEVTRARELATGRIVAVKELDSYNPQDGVPVTSLREIGTLKESRGQGNIVELLEVVMTKDNNIALVLEFVEHDLMTLQHDMVDPFMPSEIKTLMLQITAALDFLHTHWILHRDLKTSNILLTNQGCIKLADFGSARFYGDPAPPNLTQLVVTLWYRAPELILGASTYDESIDIWSLGCILGELFQKGPIMQGKSELDQITKIFELCGLPNDKNWPGFRRLPNVRSLNLPSSTNDNDNSHIARSKFPLLTQQGNHLLSDLLSLNPARRPTAAEVLEHPYFSEDPRPKATSMFPSFPSKAQGERRRILSPAAPRYGGQAPKLKGNLGDLFASRDAEESGAGFALKVG